MGNATLAGKLDAQDFVDEHCGLPTVKDILAELAKPGRDPRSEFKVAQFTEGVNDLEDLKAGMILEGVITNVTKFGAFVDLGVHQDGLIHISELANEYVQTPSDVVSVGDVVRVKVLEVDLQRRRIASLPKAGVSDRAPILNDIACQRSPRLTESSRSSARRCSMSAGRILQVLVPSSKCSSTRPASSWRSTFAMRRSTDE